MSPVSTVLETAPFTRKHRRNTSPLIYLGLGLIGLILGLLAVSSLGSNSNSTFSFVGASIAPPGGGGSGQGGNGGDGEKTAGNNNGGGGNAAADPLAKAQASDRKIIYTATVEVAVKDVDQTLAAIDRLLEAHQARLSRSEARSDTGRRRNATITLEVPVDRFRPLLAALKELGAPERESVDSKDVTEEYVDLKARLKNLREQEDKLNELLREKRRVESLEDIIRVSDRIAEVRQVVERVEGRMKFLDTKAAFSTIALTIREMQEYQPVPTASAPAPPTLPERISTSFDRSWGLVGNFGSRLVLFFVTITPWLLVIIPVGIALLWLVPRLAAENAGTKLPQRCSLATSVSTDTPSAETTEP